MEQYIEFIGNHPFLMLGLVAIVGIIGYLEFDRLTSGIKAISVPDATRMQNDSDALFVDVREDKEFQTGHIVGAKRLPLSTINTRIGELSKFKDKPIIVYCETGMRSGKAAKALKKAGHTEVHNLAGGLASWSKASMPLVTK